MHVSLCSVVASVDWLTKFRWQTLTAVVVLVILDASIISHTHTPVYSLSLARSLARRWQRLHSSSNLIATVWPECRVCLCIYDMQILWYQCKQAHTHIPLSFPPASLSFCLTLSAFELPVVVAWFAYDVAPVGTAALQHASQPWPGLFIC